MHKSKEKNPNITKFTKGQEEEYIKNTSEAEMVCDLVEACEYIDQKYGPIQDQKEKNKTIYRNFIKKKRK